MNEQINITLKLDFWSSERRQKKKIIFLNFSK